MSAHDAEQTALVRFRGAKRKHAFVRQDDGSLRSTEWAFFFHPGERLRVRVRSADLLPSAGRLTLLFHDLSGDVVGQTALDLPNEGGKLRVSAPLLPGRGTLLLGGFGEGPLPRVTIAIDPIRAHLREADEPASYHPDPWFMPEWVRRTTLARAKRAGDPWEDYRTRAGEEVVSPHPLFEVDWYRRANDLPDGVDPLAHYIAAGASGPVNQAGAAAASLGLAATAPGFLPDEPAAWTGRCVRRLTGARDTVGIVDSRFAAALAAGPAEADVAVLLLGRADQPGAAESLEDVAGQTARPREIVSADPTDPQALDRACASLTAAFVAPLELGDRWEADHLRALLAARAQKSGPLVVAGWCEKNELTGRARFFSPQDALEAAYGGRVPASALLVERGALPPFDATAAPAAVADWVLRILLESSDATEAPMVTSTKSITPPDPAVAQAIAAAAGRAFARQVESGGEPGLVTIIVEASGRAGRLGPLLTSLVQCRDRTPHEILIVDAGVVERDRPLLVEWARLFSHVRLLEAPCPLAPGAATSVGASAARGAHLLLLDPGVTLNDGSLDALQATIARTGATAVLGVSIHSDGALFDPAEGSEEAAVLVHRDAFAAVCGLNPRAGAERLHGDLLARLSRRAGKVAIAAGARLTRHAERVQPMHPPKLPLRRASLPAAAFAAPSLRLAIKVSRWDEPHRNSGDLHFAHALGQALRGEGAKVRIDETRDWYAAAQSDDVVLVLRGRWRYRPSPRHRNFLWLISHPEDATAAELSEFDHIFAASQKLTQRARAAGLPASTLLQCTDPEVFHPPKREPSRDLLFVGNSRLANRPLVAAAAAEALPLSLHGRDWERFPAGIMVDGLALAQRDVAARYRRGIVFNDHWPDMAEAGILSNRLFDAAASAAPIISDHVEGIEMFAPAVQCWSPDEPLAPIAAAALAHGAALFDARVGLAEHIRTEQSFRARARAIMAIVHQDAPQAGASAAIVALSSAPTLANSNIDL